MADGKPGENKKLMKKVVFFDHLVGTGRRFGIFCIGVLLSCGVVQSKIATTGSW